MLKSDMITSEDQKSEYHHFIFDESERLSRLIKNILHAKQSKISALSLGFSDQATVYLNGKILYSGSNKFKSRDYRYLGTIGLFDTVYLPLKKGNNELVNSVTESFGGWGIKAALKDN